MSREFSTRYDKTCETCQSSFVARYVLAKFCSQRCKEWAHSRPGRVPPPLRPKVRGCESCGADMTGRHGNARFCDQSCWYRFHNPLADVTAPLSCDVCLAIFFRKTPRGIVPKFCSPRCEQWRRRNPDATWDPDRTCEHCGVSIAHMRADARYCTAGHAAAAKGHERRVKIRSLPREKISHVRVFERDGWRCHLCSRKINPSLKHPHPKSASLDHVIPISDPDSPGHVWANVAASHLTCNLRKNNKSMGEQLMLFGAA